MVVVKMTEMYDLATTKEKIGVIGIHTPNSQIISRRWRGLFMNHKFFRVLSCNVRVACASILPADPLQVNVASGSIAPQDIMNPILYRAVSNESFNFIVGRIYGASGESSSIKFIADINSGTSLSSENVYYTLLGDKGWKKAMPQNGFQMKGLVPLVHEVVDTYGNMDTLYGTMAEDLNSHPASSNNGVAVTHVTSEGQVLRGRAKRYPRIACTSPDTGSDSANPSLVENPIAKTYVGCIVLPPAKLKEFYFRVVVDWFIEFTGVVPLTEKLNTAQLAGVGSLVYARSYLFPSAKDLNEMSPDTDNTQESTLDAIDTDLNLIMES